MSDKQGKKGNGGDQGPQYTKVSAKINIPPEKLAPIIADLNVLRITEKPDDVKQDIVAKINNLIDEAFGVGLRVGKQITIQEIKKNKGMLHQPKSGLIVPAHAAASRKKDDG